MYCRLARQGDLSPEEIMEALFARDPDPLGSDDEGQPYDENSDREHHLEDDFPFEHQEEVEEIRISLADEEMDVIAEELGRDLVLGGVMDQSALRRSKLASSPAAGLAEPNVRPESEPAGPDVPPESPPRPSPPQRAPTTPHGSGKYLCKIYVSVFFICAAPWPVHLLGRSVGPPKIGVLL